MVDLWTIEQAAAREVLHRLTESSGAPLPPVSNRTLDLLLGLVDGTYRLSRQTDGETIQRFPRY